jgi:hypothetical protein
LRLGNFGLPLTFKASYVQKIIDAAELRCCLRRKASAANSRAILAIGRAQTHWPLAKLPEQWKENQSRRQKDREEYGNQFRVIHEPLLAS